MSKLLFVCPNFKSDNPRGLRIKNLSRLLPKNMSIDILHFNSDGLLSESDYTMQFGFLSNLAYGAERLKPKYIPKSFFKFFSRLINYLIKPDFYILERKKILKRIIALDEKNNYDVVVLVIYPFSSYTLVEELKRKLKVKIIGDIGDPLSFNSAISNIPISYKRLEQRALDSLDGIIVTTKSTKDEFIERFSLDSRRIEIIPQGVDIQNVQTNSSEWHIRTDLRLMYAGSFYKNLREPKELFKAIDSSMSYSLDIFGNQFSNEYYPLPKNVSYCGLLSNEMLLKYYCNYDLIVFIDNSHGSQMSGKIFELLALRKPILFIYNNSSSEAYNLVKNLSFVFCVKNCQKEITHTLEGILTNGVSNLDFSCIDVNSLSWASRANSYANFISKIV